MPYIIPMRNLKFPAKTYAAIVLE